MRRFFISALTCLAAAVYGSGISSAQTYSQTPVTVSKEVVKNSDGKYYYSHVVQERQTLFSIAKAYGVSVDDICNANSGMDLKGAGLKKDAIIFIPANNSTDKPQTGGSRQDSYTTHVVKWFENLDDIAEKYSISKDVLMKYNGMKSEKLKARQKLRIPSQATVMSMQESVKDEGQKQKQEQTGAGSRDKDASSAENDSFAVTPGIHRKVSAVLMLPFGASSAKPSESNMDFYSGVLMALKHLSAEGIDTDLSVFDVSNGINITADRLRQSDFTIGPLSSQDLSEVLASAPEETFIISPLDHRTASLVNSHRNFIQAPASQESQYADLLKWVKEERRSGDRIIIISEKNAKATTGTALMEKAITESGLPVTRFSYSILQGRNAASSMSQFITASGTNRVIINSESEAFVNDAVRNLDMLAYRQHDVVLYSSSKIRSYETIDVENLHMLKTRISTAYYIDYGNASVKRFLMEYRALYGTEPTQFSFQGYDLAYFFIKEKALYGNNWMDKVCRSGNTPMMQTDLLFRESGNGGYCNSGIRRIVYGQDFSIKIARK